MEHESNVGGFLHRAAAGGLNSGSAGRQSEYMTATAPLRRGEIMNLADELIKTGESVLVRLNQLQVPLSPVLQPALPTNTPQISQAEPVPQSELAVMLHTVLRSLRETHASLTALEQRLML